jgi:hypothetical protein
MRGLRPATRSRRIILSAGVVVLAIAAAFMFWLQKPSADASLDSNLIAILPFRVTSVDPSLSYLGEGMVDLLSATTTGSPTRCAGHGRNVDRITDPDLEAT